MCWYPKQVLRRRTQESADVTLPPGMMTEVLTWSQLSSNALAVDLVVEGRPGGGSTIDTWQIQAIHAVGGGVTHEQNFAPAGGIAPGNDDAQRLSLPDAVAIRVLAQSNAGGAIARVRLVEQLI